MFNLIRDDFDSNSDDILNSINKMLERNKKEQKKDDKCNNEVEEENKKEQKN